jgi:hypothetical protein
VRLGQRQQFQALGIGHEHQPVQKGQRRLKDLIEIDLAIHATPHARRQLPQSLIA